MSADAISPAEVSSLYAELLPARTVLSLFSLDSAGTNGAPGSNSQGTPQINVAGIPLSIPQVGK